MRAESQVCRTKPDQIQLWMASSAQTPSGAISQAGQRAVRALGLSFPLSQGYSGHFWPPALHTDTLAAQQIWQGCSGWSPRDVLSTPRTQCPSCRELWLLKTRRSCTGRHGFLLTLHCADSSWTSSSCLEEKLVAFYFPTSHLPTESILKACRCLVPLSPTESSFLWRALGIHTAP